MRVMGRGNQGAVGNGRSQDARAPGAGTISSICPVSASQDAAIAGGNDGFPRVPPEASCRTRQRVKFDHPDRRLVRSVGSPRPCPLHYRPLLEVAGRAGPRRAPFRALKAMLSMTPARRYSVRPAPA